MIAIDTVVRFQSGFCCQAKTHERGFDCSRYLVDGMIAVDLLEAALVAVVFDDGRGLGLEGLHTLGEYGLGVVGALNEV